MINRQEIIANLQTHGLELPKIAPPAGSYVGTKIHNHTLYVSGQLPMQNGKIVYQGKLGDDVSLDDGMAAAQLVALNIIGQIDHALNQDWSKFEALIRLNGFVNSTADFFDHPKIINGASDFMANILGDQGKHTRIALGVAALPFNAAVEIDAIIGLHEPSK